MTEALIDPDCRDGKHQSCVGCGCDCHVTTSNALEGGIFG
jgi:hypothetical protein